MAFGGRTFAGGMFADAGTVAVTPQRYGAGTVTDYATNPLGTITDRGNTTAVTATDRGSGLTASVTDRSSG